MKTFFRYRPFYVLAAVVSFLLLTGGTRVSQAADQLPDKPDLLGKVLNQDGTSVPGASVFVYTASAREVPNSICPSCYPDCGKLALTDASGQFKIEAVDPALVFKLLVVAKGYRPAFVRKVDPFGKASKARLEQSSQEALSAKQKLVGRVLDPKGNPVFGAVVTFEIYHGEGGDCAGKCEDVDAMAVTDRTGEFVLTARKPFDWMTVQIEARHLARKKFFKLPSGKLHELHLTDGAMVKGQVLENGRPVAGIALRLVPAEIAENNMDTYEICTDVEGRFHFLNVAPYQYYNLSSVAGALSESGILPIRKVRVVADSSASDVGQLQRQPGIRVSGRVVLVDGNPVPLNTVVILEVKGVKKARRTTVDSAGGFIFSNVPAGPVAILVRIPDYRLSDKNKSLDRLNGGGLTGKVSAAVEGLMVLLEPGQARPMAPEKMIQFVNSAPKEEVTPQDYPLRGAEGF